MLKRILDEYSGTVLWVTHNLDQVVAADLVWHIEDGRLVEVSHPGDSRYFTHVRKVKGLSVVRKHGKH